MFSPPPDYIFAGLFETKWARNLEIYSQERTDCGKHGWIEKSFFAIKKKWKLYGRCSSMAQVKGWELGRMILFNHAWICLPQMFIFFHISLARSHFFPSRP